MNVVFTGPAKAANGNSILRADLVKAAQEAGFTVHAQMCAGVDLLVASRTDTQKAIMAKKLGIAVVDYPKFFDMVIERLDKQPTALITADKSKHKPDPYVDDATVEVDEDDLIPDFTAEYGGVL